MKHKNKKHYWNINNKRNIRLMSIINYQSLFQFRMYNTRRDRKIFTLKNAYLNYGFIFKLY